MAMPASAERLDHILDAIAQIETATAGMSKGAFEANRFVRLGVERCIEIISEAVRHLPDDWKSRHTQISWRQVADIGNRIRHAYHAVDSEIIWAIVEVDLVDLKMAIEAMKQPNDRALGRQGEQ